LNISFFSVGTIHAYTDAGCFLKIKNEVAMNPFENLKNKKTLLVDDDELIRDSMSIAFKNKGCLLQTAETAEEGLQALKEDSFDVIISDFKLPGIDGIEFLKLATASHPNTVKILITAYGEKDTVSEALGAGAQDFIEKPFSIKTLIDSLNRLIQSGKEKRGKL
jgi:DNA-binding NtrC family response regulator